MQSSKIIADYHVHSDFSSDAKAPMEQMIKQAILLGLRKLCFTDHMDYDYPPVSEYTFLFEIENYVKALEEYKKKYKSKIDILTGIELGLQPHLKDKIASLTNQYSFDFIIGSSHVVNFTDPYYPEYWKDKTVEEGICAYFQTIIDNCKIFDNFHVYGHIDYIVRYIPGQASNKIYHYEDYTDLLDEVLKTLISHGKGIEVNTAGYKYGIGHAHPKIEILKRYKELGGELITLGSDAHKPEHLCYDFPKAFEMLKYCGYQYYATFVQGKPIYEKL